MSTPAEPRLPSTPPVILRRAADELPELDHPLQRILKAAEIRRAHTRVSIPSAARTGDDCDQPPTVILDKTPDNRIRRITVRCACGRHAELLCEYDDEEGA